MCEIPTTLITLVAIISLTSTPAIENSELPTENVQLFIVESLPINSNEGELVCDSTAEPDGYTTNISSEQDEVACVEESESINPYAELEISESEKILLAKMVYAEARGESFEGQVAVVQVALNRVLSNAWGNTVTAVLTQKNQFIIGSTYTDIQMQAVEEALSSATLPLPTDVYYFSPGKCTYGTYYTTIGNHNFYQ